MFEYPRSQKLMITAAILLSCLLVCDMTTTHTKIFVIALSLNIVYLTYQIWPYTFFARKQMKRVEERDPDREFKLFIANVFQDNRDVKSCLQMIEKA